MFRRRSWRWFELRVRAIVTMRESLFGMTLENQDETPPAPPTASPGEELTA